MTIRIIAFIAIFIFQSFQGNAQEILLMPDTNQALVGERINLILAIKAERQTNIEWPEIGETISGLEVLSKTRKDTSEDARGLLYRQGFTVTAFDTGVYKIDSVMLKFQRGSLTDSIISYPVYIGYNTIQLDSTNRYYDIKQPMDIEYSYWFEILMGILCTVAVAAVLWFLIKRRKPKEEKVEKKIIIPPHIPALKKLNAMRDGKVWMDMIIKEYYVDLTDVLRKYISGRLKINAMEYTTDEIMDEINDTTIGVQHKMELQDLLQMSDLVKFAKIHPLPEEGEKYLTTALNFVYSTKSDNDKPTKESNDA
jgi:hypothetical protein